MQIEIKTLAKELDVTTRTLLRGIEKYNEVNQTSFPASLKVPISDQKLLDFLRSKKGKVKVEPKPKKLNGHSHDKPEVRPEPKPIIKKEAKPEPTKKNNPFLFVLAILVIILVGLGDILAFGETGQHFYGEKHQHAFWFFAFIGVGSLIGVVVAYYGINDRKSANWYETRFAILQFSLFIFASNQYWFASQMIMSIMFVLSFRGALASIKN